MLSDRAWGDGEVGSWIFGQAVIYLQIYLLINWQMYLKIPPQRSADIPGVVYIYAEISADIFAHVSADVLEMYLQISRLIYTDISADTYTYVDIHIHIYIHIYPYICISC